MDWMDELVEYILPIQQEAKLEFPQGGSKKIECPKCKGELWVVVDMYNQHCRGSCKTDGCIDWME